MTGVPATPPDSVRRIVFLGTPDVSAVALRSLAEAGFDIPLVVTRADKRRGRGSTLVPSPVKETAADLGLAVTSDLSEVDGVEADLGVVVAYGRIIPLRALERLAMVNIHFSLLPRWRGAAPVERAILAGDAETGVCLMEVAEGLDEGAVYAKVATEIEPEETASELRSRLADLGAELLVSSLQAGLGEPVAQVGEVTYAAKLDKSEFRLDLSRSAADVHRCVRIGRAWAEFRGKRLGIEQARLHLRSNLLAEAPPGTIAAIDGTDGADENAGSAVVVATADGAVELLTVKPEGKRAMPARDWVNGAQPGPGERLG